MKTTKSRHIVSLATIALGLLFFGSFSATAEQYTTGTQERDTALGRMLINIGHVSHFNANDFYVYTFMFRPEGSQQWHQVPRIEQENDPKMLFTLQTKHTADAILFDARLISFNQKTYLVTGHKETVNTLADDGPVLVSIYHLVKLDDYERWVFLRKTTYKTVPKTSVEQALSNAGKKLVE